MTELRDVVEQQTRGQFTIGDRALEIEPMRQRGGPAAETEYTVEQSMKRLADDIGLSVTTVKTTRWVASRWPKKHRRPELASYSVHRALANIENDGKRFAAILTPPDGKARWTTDDASQRVGQQVETRITPQEKITAIHSLARDEEVVAAVTTDFLKRPQVAAKVSADDKVRVVEEFTRDETVAATAATSLRRRPDVAFRAMSDDTARFQVNHAQNERNRQAREDFDRTSPVAPAVSHRTEHGVPGPGHGLPLLSSRRPDGSSRPCATTPSATTNARSCTRNVARCRATLDWVEMAVDTGKVDMDDELARLLEDQ